MKVAESVLRPAATVVLLHDRPDGLQVLFVRRPDQASAYGGMWVFPGGKVDASDGPERETDPVVLARHAAARELDEETGLVIDPDSLVPLSHWTPSREAPRRFSTWFFVTLLREAKNVTLNTEELVEYCWRRPSEMLALHAVGQVQLAAPTFVTLSHLSGYDSAAAAVSEASQRHPPAFEGKRTRVSGVPVVLFQGDDAYEDESQDASGSRHRLWMYDCGWRYERKAHER